MLRMLLCFSFFLKKKCTLIKTIKTMYMFVVSDVFIFNADTSLQKEEMMVGPRKGLFCRIIKSIYHSKVH